MTDSQAKQVPLIDLLDAVPVDVRIGMDDGNDWKAGTTWHPVGRLCHDASVELRRLRAEILIYHDDRLRLSNEVDRLKAAQREWVGLDQDDIDKLKHMIDWTATWSYGKFACEIERILKEKNA